ncbi:unnamed protein product [Chilo suppressalis]|uniref:Vesicular, overexpressed in cancer, prosurvival protein 1 n=1 Tax=Chilo suppressalis TaxID=168631 RepID=A0ABN8L9S4_CHISP|nr:unnamed protein product [Chilo suppressalis]
MVGVNPEVVIVPIIGLWVCATSICIAAFWYDYWQKTRSSQQRRVCVGPRTRQLSVQEPSIYVSPANLPPPPKYEAMAPPSYEEVVGVHYPGGYQSQPITQPITQALSTAQSSTSAEQNTTLTSTCETTSVPAPAPPPAIITVTTEQRRTSVTARS